MIRVIMFTALFALSMAKATPADDCCAKPCCAPRCPQCQACCKLTCESSTEKKHCYCLESKAICLPKIQFPWQSCCAPKCARVKWVSRLKKVEYECHQCKHKWVALEISGRCSGGCTVGE